MLNSVLIRSCSGSVKAQSIANASCAHVVNYNAHHDECRSKVHTHTGLSVGTVVGLTIANSKQQPAKRERHGIHWQQLENLYTLSVCGHDQHESEPNCQLLEGVGEIVLFHLNVVFVPRERIDSIT